MNNDEIYEGVLQEVDELAHYGRLGMKWYQHIFGEYQGAAKYAEKGEKRLAKSREKDSFVGVKSARTKRLEQQVNAVKKARDLAKPKYEAEEASKKKKAEAEAKEIKRKADAEARELARKTQAEETEAHKQKILDLAQGKADWRNATAEELQEAIGRLTVEKQYKALRDDVSGAKVLKQLGVDAASSVAKNAGTIVNNLLLKAAEGHLAEVKSEIKLKEAADERAYKDKKQKEKDEKEEKAAAKADADAKKKQDAADKAAAKAETDAKKKQDDNAKRFNDLLQNGPGKDTTADELKAATTWLNNNAEFMKAKDKRESEDRKRAAAEAARQQAEADKAERAKNKGLDLREDESSTGGKDYEWLKPEGVNTKYKRITSDTAKATRDKEAAAKEKEYYKQHVQNKDTSSELDAYRNLLSGRSKSSSSEYSAPNVRQQTKDSYSSRSNARKINLSSLESNRKFNKNSKMETSERVSGKSKKTSDSSQSFLDRLAQKYVNSAASQVDIDYKKKKKKK